MPSLDGFVEFGGELIDAVDFTAGGAPIGLTAGELRDFEMQDQLARNVGWAVAKRVLEEVARTSGTRNLRDAVDRVRFIGEGLSHVVYGASVLLANQEERSLVVKLPSRDAPTQRDDCVRREARLLRWLAQADLPFRIPGAVAEVETGRGLAAVQDWLPGIERDLRSDRFPGGRPWEFVGRVAAAVHAVPIEPLRAIRGHTTRLEHALAYARWLEDLDEPDREQAADWVRENLPPPEPSCLIHGDLLGQNLRFPIEDEIPGVLDWSEALLGDPAYDLAIVTRGVRRPFGKEHGLQLLVEAYNRHASTPLTVANVQLYEVILKAKFCLYAADRYGHGSAHAESERQVLRSLLARLT